MSRPSKSQANDLNCNSLLIYSCFPWLLLQELAHEEVVRQLKVEQAKQVTKLRQEVEQGAKDLAQKAEQKMKVCAVLTIRCM